MKILTMTSRFRQFLIWAEETAFPYILVAWFSFFGGMIVCGWDNLAALIK